MTFAEATYRARGRSKAAPIRRIVFLFLAGFIVLAPGLPQVFEIRSLFLRPWIMFSGVGVGTLKGTFKIAYPGGPNVEKTPLELLGWEAYPPIRHYDFDRLVFKPADLKAFAAEACASLPDDVAVSFDGFTGTRHGWKRLDVTDICHLEPEGPK